MPASLRCNSKTTRPVTPESTLASAPGEPASLTLASRAPASVAPASAPAEPASLTLASAMGKPASPTLASGAPASVAPASAPGEPASLTLASAPGEPASLTLSSAPSEPASAAGPASIRPPSTAAPESSVPASRGLTPESRPVEMPESCEPVIGSLQAAPNATHSIKTWLNLGIVNRSSDTLSAATPFASALRSSPQSARWGRWPARRRHRCRLCAG